MPQLHRHFLPGQLHVPDFVVFFDDVDDRPSPYPLPLPPTPTPDTYPFSAHLAAISAHLASIYRHLAAISAQVKAEMRALVTSMARVTQPTLWLGIGLRQG